MVNENETLDNKPYEVFEFNGKEVRVFQTLNSKRQEDETFEEYKIRQKLVKKYENDKRSGTWFHVSSMLVPAMNEDGKVILNFNKRPIYVGKTKGTSYIKETNEENHLSLVEHLKEVTNERSSD